MKMEARNLGHKQQGEGEKDGFTQVKSRRRNKGGGSSKARREPVTKSPWSTNPFEVLGEETPNTNNSKEKESGKPQEEGVRDSNGWGAADGSYGGE